MLNSNKNRRTSANACASFASFRDVVDALVVVVAAAVEDELELLLLLLTDGNGIEAAIAGAGSGATRAARRRVSSTDAPAEELNADKFGELLDAGAAVPSSTTTLWSERNCAWNAANAASSATCSAALRTSSCEEDILLFWSCSFFLLFSFFLFFVAHR